MTTLLPGERTSGGRVPDDVDLARDRLLVTRAQGGDGAAFDDLYVRYYRRLYRFCLRRLQDAHEAEDVAQEAFARAWRALPSFGGDRRFYPWLSVIAAHLCTDVLRRRSRSTLVAELHQADIASTDDGGEERVLAAVDSDLVAKAFTRLSDRHQRVLHLREGSGWSYHRIADHEGVGITAVETLLWRARQALKREFAALAGSEGRLGAWIAAVSLATGRRLRGLPTRILRRVLTTAKGGAIIVGSALATTAAVIGVTVSAPSPATIAARHLTGGTLGNPSAPVTSATVPPIALAARASSVVASAGENNDGSNGDSRLGSAPVGPAGSTGTSPPNLSSDVSRSSPIDLLESSEATVADVGAYARSAVSRTLGTTSTVSATVLGTASTVTRTVLGNAGRVVSSLSDEGESSDTGSAGTSSSPDASASAAASSDEIDSAVRFLLGGG